MAQSGLGLARRDLLAEELFLTRKRGAEAPASKGKTGSRLGGATPEKRKKKRRGERIERRESEPSPAKSLPSAHAENLPAVSEPVQSRRSNPMERRGEKSKERTRAIKNNEDWMKKTFDHVELEKRKKRASSRRARKQRNDGEKTQKVIFKLLFKKNVRRPEKFADWKAGIGRAA